MLPCNHVNDSYYYLLCQQDQFHDSIEHAVELVRAETHPWRKCRICNAIRNGVDRRQSLTCGTFILLGCAVRSGQSRCSRCRICVWHHSSIKRRSVHHRLQATSLLETNQLEQLKVLALSAAIPVQQRSQHKGAQQLDKRPAVVLEAAYSMPA